MEKICPNCHFAVLDTYYFCPNCGTNLKKAPPSVSAASQIFLYLKSFIVPPLGLWWALPYLREDNQKSRVVGIVAIIITFISLILAFKLLGDFMNSLNKQVNDAVNLYNF